MNSECDENCCICPKARKPITSESRIKAFRNNLSLSTSVHHHLEGQALLPQPPPCPVLLASNQEKLDWGGWWEGSTPAFCLRVFSGSTPVAFTGLRSWHSFDARGMTRLSSPSSCLGFSNTFTWKPALRVPPCWPAVPQALLGSVSHPYREHVHISAQTHVLCNICVFSAWDRAWCLVSCLASVYVSQKSA